MPRVRFASVLQRHVPVGEVEVPGGTVRQVLDGAFAVYPQARGYVLDEQGALRRHMFVSVGGRAVRDRARLSDAVAPDAVVDVLQLLSGG